MTKKNHRSPHITQDIGHFHLPLKSIGVLSWGPFWRAYDYDNFPDSWEIVSIPVPVTIESNYSIFLSPTYTIRSVSICLYRFVKQGSFRGSRNIL